MPGSSSEAVAADPERVWGPAASRRQSLRQDGEEDQGPHLCFTGPDEPVSTCASCVKSPWLLH